ncbi:general secretion pathway protein D [Chitinivorax tropicus]|uniref:General secretion pathway protein D n=1 Tax=Chitinivorax tropicus TaxID=714531 RepID=A0A840MSE4_9PROT|nr:secretin and TonB N-terminal domain-containing protein [Chitinivorax tropicus]MBB5020335.1 general secretion pathway protein D [Chitinivorax tropicus]
MRQWPLAGVGLIVLALSGCAGQQAFSDSKQLLAQGRTDEGMAMLNKVVSEYPNNQEYRAYLVRQRELITDRMNREADSSRLNEQYEAAEQKYREVLAMSPDNPRAQEGLRRIDTDRKHQQSISSAEKAKQEGNLDKSKQLLRQTLSENPRNAKARKMLSDINSAKHRADMQTVGPDSPLNALVTLEFQQAPLPAIFDVLSRSTGVNFVFDKDVKLDARATIMAKNTPLNEALNVLLTGQQLTKRLLNDRSVLIYPAQPGRQRELEELRVKTFYLGNVDAKNALGLIKTVVKTRDVYVDDKLNMLIMRDTPEAIAVAEKLLASQDLAEPEVMLEVEVLEISSAKLQDLGVSLPEKINLYPAKAIVDVGQDLWTIGDLKNMSRDSLRVGNISPALIVNLKNTDGVTNTLANPRIRVKNRDKAKIQIGDRVPVITTISLPNGGGTSESVNYLDVGLKVEVEPVVHMNDEVSIKIGLEVSNIADEVVSKQGLVTYKIGSRNANTSLRLKDGETQVLAGLIRQDELQSAMRVPLLGKMPVLGRLFSSEKDQKSKSELVLMITPRILRNLDVPDVSNTEFDSGTEAAVGSDALRLSNRGSEVKVPVGGADAGGGMAPPPDMGSQMPPPAPEPVQPAPPPAQPAPGTNESAQQGANKSHKRTQ